MSKSENMIAFELALKESKELREKFVAAQKRIAENKEASNDVELLVKAAAEVGHTLTVAEIERAIAQAQEINDEDLAKVAGGNWINADTSPILPFTCAQVVVGNDPTNEKPN
jgi:predicted ribosomally synthesized peptide with nif11-like leader